MLLQTVTSQFPTELRELARDVRRIGSAFRHTPEQICGAKDDIAHRLLRLADRMERSGA